MGRAATMQGMLTETKSVTRGVLLPIGLLVLVLGAAIVGAIVTGTGTSFLTIQVESLSSDSSNLLENRTGVLITWSFAFGAGMVSAVNPCGFAMLPAYMGLYLGGDETATQRAAAATRLRRALFVGLVVTSGFVLLFGIVGLAITAGAQPLVKYFAWIGLGIGVLLAVAGAWMVAGGTLYTSLAERLSVRMGNANQQSARGYFAFGLGYGTASLSCTLPIFLTVVGTTLTLGTFLDSTLQFLLYGLGMGLVILVLTLSMAIFKGALVGKVRKVLPYIQPVSAALLLLAGAYIVFYWLTIGDLLDSFS